MAQRIGIYIREAICCRRSATEQEKFARAAVLHLEAEIVGVWREGLLSPRQRRNGLPARAALRAAAKTAGIEAVVVAETAALGRSLGDLVRELAELERAGVAVLMADDQGDAPQAVGAKALDDARARYQHEASVEARARAVVYGQRLGRPRLSAERIARARAALAAGYGVRAAARLAGIGVASAFRLSQSVHGSDPHAAGGHAERPAQVETQPMCVSLPSRCDEGGFRL